MDNDERNQYVKVAMTKALLELLNTKKFKGYKD